MAVFLKLAIIVSLAIGLAVFITRLERKVRVPGLVSVLLGTILLLAAIAGLLSGQRLLPIFFALVAVQRLYEGTGPVITHMWRSRR